ncbi:hypothetical protein EHP00_2716 [Ecytonucleospora hepatopenaei]|uniref:Uncharacterized protein n=1 Tax=Ecytonucleospora hepatopenaei TaxID=646526 RepID=A0A1W0E6Q9_9MICR|nr:hypothetical protein EHP00_2716 [Ecytonucleospora hepatopenaei]
MLMIFSIKVMLLSFVNLHKIKKIYLLIEIFTLMWFLNSITNLILGAHKYHKFVLTNYKNIERSLKFKMMVTDIYMHVSVAHIIQGFTIIDEFQNLLSINIDNIKTIFSIDFYII